MITTFDPKAKVKGQQKVTGIWIQDDAALVVTSQPAIADTIMKMVLQQEVKKGGGCRRNGQLMWAQNCTWCSKKEVI